MNMRRYARGLSNVGVFLLTVLIVACSGSGDGNVDFGDFPTVQQLPLITQNGEFPASGSTQPSHSPS